LPSTCERRIPRLPGGRPGVLQAGGGVIINSGSTAGLRSRPGLAAYNATKGAVHVLTKSLAVELAPDGIRVCAIAPVATETPLLPSFLGPAEGMREKFVATIPLGRLALPQDIGQCGAVPRLGRRQIHHGHDHGGRRRPRRLAPFVRSAANRRQFVLTYR